MSAHDDAMNWLRWQWYSSGQINDAINKVSQQQCSWMSRSDIMSNIRSDTSSYFGWAPMYGSSSSWGWNWWGERVLTWEERNPARTASIWWKDYSIQTHEDWSVTVTTWGKNSPRINKDSAVYKDIMNYYNGLSSKQTNTNPHTTANESGIWDQRTSAYDAKDLENYDNAVAHYVSLWYSLKKANEMAQVWLEGRDTVSETKQDKDALLNATNKDDDDDNNSPIHDVVPTSEATEDKKTTNPNEDTLNWVADKDTYTADEVKQILEQTLWSTADSAEEWANKFISNTNTESNVVKNKAEVSKDPIFDYNTYFKENLAPEPNVGETGKVKAKPYNDSIKDVKTYQDEAISSLESLWFLEPNTEAAATMPDTEEQAAPEIAETPESLVQWFDNELTELGNSTGLAPQAVAQTYVDYKNRLAKYIKDNNVSDEEAAAMFDQLKNNEKFRDLLNITRK